MMPPMNMRPIETWLTTPYIMNAMLGGMIGPSSPPAAVIAAA